ncbi:hypothetical protein R3W88_000787 [Solanum pinnatisectum]|uniref:G-patch domain-containing protein n=1 Tax=Solanum pinnatisectum TaxID=50273 RepID=A0AAV9MJN8_9SOLN|nr:hypothetical protein R3W88_000787 [Solanum pinnatisectum]
MLTYQNPLPQPFYCIHYTQIPQPYYQSSPVPYPIYTTQPTYYPPKAPAHPNPSQYQPAYPSQSHQPQNRPSNAPKPRLNFERRPTKTYTPLAEPLVQLYERLRTRGVLQLIKGQIPNPLPGWYDKTKHCAYHSGAAEHDTESCLTLEDKIEALIKEGIIQLKGVAPNVNNNSLPNHGNVNMITVNEDYNLERTIVSPLFLQARAPIEVEAGTAGMTRLGHCYAPEEVVRGGPNKESNQKRVVIEAEVEYLWRKMPTKEYCVVEQLKKTPAQISLMSLLMNFVTHRKALVNVLSDAYVPATTTSENFFAMVGQVLEANKVTFHEDELLPEGLGHNKALNITVRCRDKFISRVLIDKGSAINIFIILLLGRPWIHMAGAVPFTLHQTLKFVWNHQEIVVHGEGNNSIYLENSVPVIESMEDSDGSVFHIRENICVTHAEKANLPHVLMMVAWEMLKNGFIPGQGLGAKLDGIVEPIQFPGQKYTFGLGYNPTPEEVSSANLKRKIDVPLPQPIPPLNQSFSKAFVAQGLEETVEDNLVEGLKNLLIEEAECNVIFEDCTKAPTI